VPTFSGIYDELGQEPPALTRTVLYVSDTIRSHAAVSLGLVLLVLAALAAALRTYRGRYLWHTFMLRMPIFGNIVTKSVMSRFARTFGILIGSGLPILESLDLVKGAADNLVVANAIDEVKPAWPPAAASRSPSAHRQVPEMVMQLMSTGEETGELDTLLDEGFRLLRPPGRVRARHLVPDRAGDDRHRRRDHRLHRPEHVPAHLQAGRRDDPGCAAM
jgi:type IV pilus assembly protein PilC